MTGRDSIPEKRWSSRPTISVTTSTIAGWACPRTALIWPLVKSRIRAARRVLDERPGRPLGHERQEVPGAAVADQMTSRASEIGTIRGGQLSHGSTVRHR